MKHNTRPRITPLRKIFSALRFLLQAPCSMLHVPCSMFHAPCSKFHEKAFTILELLIVIGIFAVLSTVAVVQLANFQRGTVIESLSKDMVSALRLVHDKAVLGEDGDVNDANVQGDTWGIRFSNSTLDSAPDTYVSFYGATYDADNVVETSYLSAPLAFTTPTAGNDTYVIFTKLTGTTTAETIVITDGTQSKTITIDASGRIGAD